MRAGQPLWVSRLRWRMRGAWMWPTFIGLTLLDGLMLHWLPPIGTGVDVVPGILLATFGNLVLVGAVAPWLARRLRARHPGPPAPPEAAREVQTDRIGTALLAAGLVGIIAAGLAARPVVVTETNDTQRNANAVRDWVMRSGDQELIANLDSTTRVRLAKGYFRDCISRKDRSKRVCLFVDVRRHPPRVVRDPSSEPNSAYRVP